MFDFSEFGFFDEICWFLNLVPLVSYVRESITEVLDKCQPVLSFFYFDAFQAITKLCQILYLQGLIPEIFTKILRGLSGVKVTRPGNFRSCQDGYAVKSSLKAEDGLLYPLEKGFFFLPKPPTLILHDEVLIMNDLFILYFFP